MDLKNLEIFQIRCFASSMKSSECAGSRDGRDILVTHDNIVNAFGPVFATLLHHPNQSRDPVREPIFHSRFWNFREHLPDRKDSIVVRRERCPAEFSFCITKKEEVAWCYVWDIRWMRPLCGFVDSIFSGESRDL
jgi:hypothetical protein